MSGQYIQKCSYHIPTFSTLFKSALVSDEQAGKVLNAVLDAGADGVKMEGEAGVVEQVSAVAGAGIAVCAHIGYTPQTDGDNARVQGKDLERAIELLQAAEQLESAGASMMVLELIPERLSGEITSCLAIPTIGIGAGRDCDGQVQVVLDIAGLSPRVYRHAKAYASLGDGLRRAVSAYAGEVRDGVFPAQENTSRLPDDVFEEVRAWCEEHRPREGAAE